jgi:hypothetical protein
MTLPISPIPPTAEPKPPADDSMRRLQIGISGVLAILLLVGLAGLIGNRAREEAGVGSKTVNNVTMPGDAEKSKGSGPLVELGVQPASAPAPMAKEPDETILPPRVAVPDLEPDPELERARKTQK